MIPSVEGTEVPLKCLKGVCHHFGADAMHVCRFLDGASIDTHGRGKHPRVPRAQEAPVNGTDDHASKLGGAEGRP